MALEHRSRAAAVVVGLGVTFAYFLVRVFEGLMLDIVEGVTGLRGGGEMSDQRIEIARDLARVRDALAETCAQEMAGDGLYELARAEADRRAELMPLRDAMRSVHSDVLAGRLHLGRVDA